MPDDDKAREKIKQKRLMEGVEATFLNKAAMEETCVR